MFLKSALKSIKPIDQSGRWRVKINHGVGNHIEEKRRVYGHRRVMTSRAAAVHDEKKRNTEAERAGALIKEKEGQDYRRGTGVVPSSVELV